MPAQVVDLIRDKVPPVTTRPDATIAEVLSLMIKHDYSQLPVIDADNKPTGLVTCDSIVRALHHFGVTTENLLVRDAMVKKPSEYYAADDLFDLLDDLEQGDAVHIIDGKGMLRGIVTTYDTTEYLRQRSQDIMYVRDIEEMIKTYINQAFLDTTGNIDLQKQTAAIAAITPNNSGIRGKFGHAVIQYLGKDHKINKDALDAAFDACLSEQTTPKSFDKLTLKEYIELLIHKSRWSVYSSVFSLDRDAIRRLLAAITKTRNDLAHFRDDISAQQRQELIFAKDWLARHESALAEAFTSSTIIALSEPQSLTTSEVDTPIISVVIDELSTATDDVKVDTEIPIAPIDEQSDTSEGRYSPLIQNLLRQRRDLERITYRFSEIDDLLGEYRLPESARRHRAWWANDSVGHSHSQQWLNAGWRVASLNMSEERVIFARHKERERLYIDFFSALLGELHASPAGEAYLHPSPDGQSWMSVAAVSHGRHRVAYFNFSFTQTRRFRVELYIDFGEQATNKRLFDALLAQRESIEADFGEVLSWERIDDRRASRVARYYSGTISDSATNLQTLRTRVVTAMNRFHTVLLPRIGGVLPGVFREHLLQDT